MFNGSNGPAREQAMTLMLELSRWIGRAPLQALLEGGSIRSAQKTEFDRLFGEREGAGGVPTPTVWLRKDRPSPGLGAVEAAGAGGSVETGSGSNDSVWRDVGGTGSDQNKGASPSHKVKGSNNNNNNNNNQTLTAAQLRDASREYLDEVDLSKRLKAAAVSGPANDFTVLVGSEKWSDQLKALQMVIDILGSTPKVTTGGKQPEQSTSHK